jgi:hypothetical protein
VNGLLDDLLRLEVAGDEQEPSDQPAECRVVELLEALGVRA